MLTNRTVSILVLLLSPLVVLLEAGCQKGDAVRPTIDVFGPADNQGFVATGLARITGRATDNKALAEVTAVLTESFTGQVLGSVTETLSGVESDFSLDLKLGDRYTETGEYSLLITVFDQAGNSARETIPLQLTELPRVLERPLWAGETGSGATVLYFLDSLEQVGTGPMLGTGLSTLLVDNRNRLLLSSELYGGRFTARHLGEFDLQFLTDLPTGSQQEGITGISAWKSRFYLSVNVPPYLRVFDLLGAQIAAWDEVLYPGRQVLAGEERVWVSVRGFNGSPTKTDVYHSASHQLQATNVLGWEVRHLRSMPEGHLLAAGNVASLGRVRVLDGLSMVEEDDLDLQEELLGLDGEGEDWFLLLESGLWRFHPDNATITGPLVAGDYLSLGWEPENGRIYLGKENRVEVYDANGGLVRTFNGGYGEVKWIDFQYNK